MSVYPHPTRIGKMSSPTCVCPPVRGCLRSGHLVLLGLILEITRQCFERPVHLNLLHVDHVYTSRIYMSGGNLSINNCLIQECILECGSCGHLYGANGSVICLVNCPRCDGGQLGAEWPWWIADSQSAILGVVLKSPWLGAGRPARSSWRAEQNTDQSRCSASELISRFLPLGSPPPRRARRRDRGGWRRCAG